MTEHFLIIQDDYECADIHRFPYIHGRETSNHEEIEKLVIPALARGADVLLIQGKEIKIIPVEVAKKIKFE